MLYVRAVLISFLIHKMDGSFSLYYFINENELRCKQNVYDINLMVLKAVENHLGNGTSTL